MGHPFTPIRRTPEAAGEAFDSPRSEMTRRNDVETTKRRRNDAVPQFTHPVEATARRELLWPQVGRRLTNMDSIPLRIPYCILTKSRKCIGNSRGVLWLGRLLGYPHKQTSPWFRTPHHIHHLFWIGTQLLQVSEPVWIPATTCSSCRRSDSTLRGQSSRNKHAGRAPQQALKICEPLMVDFPGLCEPGFPAHRFVV